MLRLWAIILFCVLTYIHATATLSKELARQAVRALRGRPPDRQVPEVRVDLPPLGRAPRKERFTGPLKPIPAFR